MLLWFCFACWPLTCWIFWCVLVFEGLMGAYNKKRWCICPWHEIKWKERWTELERTSQDSNSGRLNRNHAMCNLKIGLFAMLYRRAYEPARLSLCRWSRTQQHVCSSSPKITCGTPLLISLHWLPVVPESNLRFWCWFSELPLKKRLPYPNSLLEVYKLRPWNKWRVLFLHNFF